MVTLGFSSKGARYLERKLRLFFFFKFYCILFFVHNIPTLMNCCQTGKLDTLYQMLKCRLCTKFWSARCSAKF